MQIMLIIIRAARVRVGQPEPAGRAASAQQSTPLHREGHLRQPDQPPGKHHHGHPHYHLCDYYNQVLHTHNFHPFCLCCDTLFHSLSNGPIIMMICGWGWIIESRIRSLCSCSDHRDLQRDRADIVRTAPNKYTKMTSHKYIEIYSHKYSDSVTKYFHKDHNKTWR